MIKTTVMSLPVVNKLVITCKKNSAGAKFADFTAKMHIHLTRERLQSFLMQFITGFLKYHKKYHRESSKDSTPTSAIN